MESDQDGTRPLQFETAVPRLAPPEGGAASAGVTCAACQRTIVDEYFDINGQSICGTCREQLARHAETPQGWGVLARAGLFGLGAAILGAILYYAVIAVTNFEIGIVAIAIGYMVGYAVRKGAGGQGGRRFQVVALVLTYWAVGLAYMPLAIVGGSRPAEEPAQTTAAAPSPGTASEAEESGPVNVPLAVAFLLGFSFALPVLAVAGSMPGGLISAAIIAFGMLQAWRMTGAPQFQITGPYRIAGESPAST